MRNDEKGYICQIHVHSALDFAYFPRGEENIPAFPAHAQPVILRIFQEAHGYLLMYITRLLMWDDERVEFANIANDMFDWYLDWFVPY